MSYFFLLFLLSAKIHDFPRQLGTMERDPLPYKLAMKCQSAESYGEVSSAVQDGSKVSISCRDYFLVRNSNTVFLHESKSMEYLDVAVNYGLANQYVGAPLYKVFILLISRFLFFIN